MHPLALDLLTMPFSMGADPDEELRRRAELLQRTGTKTFEELTTPSVQIGQHGMPWSEEIARPGAGPLLVPAGGSASPVDQSYQSPLSSALQKPSMQQMMGMDRSTSPAPQFPPQPTFQMPRMPRLTDVDPQQSLTIPGMKIASDILGRLPTPQPAATDPLQKPSMQQMMGLDPRTSPAPKFDQPAAPMPPAAGGIQPRPLVDPGIVGQPPKPISYGSQFAPTAVPAWGDVSNPTARLGYDVPLSVYRRGGTVVDSMPADQMTPQLAAAWAARQAADQIGGPIPIPNWAAATGQHINESNGPLLSAQANAFQLNRAGAGQDVAQTAAFQRGQDIQAQAATADRQAQDARGAAELKNRLEVAGIAHSSDAMLRQAIQATILDDQQKDVPPEVTARKIANMKALGATAAGGPTGTGFQAIPPDPAAALRSLLVPPKEGAAKTVTPENFGEALNSLANATPEQISSIAQGINAGRYGPTSQVENHLSLAIVEGYLKTLPFGSSGMQNGGRGIVGPHVDITTDRSFAGAMGQIFPTMLTGRQPVSGITIKTPEGPRSIPIGDAPGSWIGNALRSNATVEDLRQRRRISEALIGEMFKQRQPRGNP